MNFLNPGFLFALSVLAIPVIIHLFNFRKFKRVYFSNVQFLKEVKEQNSSKEKLKNLLILFSRLLALMFLVMAFARPYIPGNKTAVYKANQVVSIYIDNSYSMETVNKEGTLLDNAKRSAVEIAKGFSVNARFRLVTNDFEGRHQRMLNFEEFKDAVAEVKISSAARTMQQVVTRLENDDVSYSYLISDFQSGFTGTEKIKARKEVNLALIKLNANGLPNISADSAWFLSPVHKPNTAERLVVRLRNFGAEDAKNVSMKLTINGTQKAISSINIPAGKSRTDTLGFSGLSEGWQKGEVLIKDYPLTFDDQLRFAFHVKGAMKVLAINGQQPGAYLRALFGADDFFKLTEMQEQNINYADFSNYSFIVLNGLSAPSSGLAEQLKRYLQGGGTVAVFPNLDGDKNAQSAMLSGIGLPAISGITKEATRVAAIDLKHPLFSDMFEQLPRNLDLPVANRFFSYAGTGSGREELLQFAGSRTFLAGFNAGTGKAYLFATGLNMEDSNLPKHPFFVPMLFKMAFSSLKGQRLFYTVGKDNLLQTGKITLGANQSLKLTSENFEAIPELNQQGANASLYIADQVKNAGFYQLVKGDSTLSVYAFNNTGAESDMQYSSASSIKDLYGKLPVTFFDTRKDSLPSKELISNNGKELWKLCLVLAALFLAAEIFLIKFFNSFKITGKA